MIRKSLAVLIAAASLSLASCAPMLAAMGGLPPSPAAAADQTRLDEQAALSVELAYQAANQAVSFAVDLGFIRGERATRLAAIDRRAYRAVLTARVAYDAGNAASYGAAVVTARAEILALLNLANER